MLPTPHTLGVRRRVEGAKDAHGNPVVTHNPAAPADPLPWSVHGYAPGASERKDEPNRDASEILWTVYAPVSTDAPGELDLVVLGGEEYAVSEFPSDWTNSPWQHPTAGLVVELKRKEG